MHQYQDHTLIQDHIENWKASGVSQANYCKQQGIKPHIFSYYKKKFSSIPDTVKRHKLIPIKLIPEADSVSALRTQHPLAPLIKISHTNGFSLEILLNSELSSLKPVLELVGSIA